jgi:hypothetical protein
LGVQWVGRGFVPAWFPHPNKQGRGGTGGVDDFHSPTPIHPPVSPSFAGYSRVRRQNHLG